MGDDRSAKIGCTVQTLLEWVKNARALVAFPMARHRPIFNRRRSLTD